MTFLQLHTLTSYPSTLLNRDDVGFAKRIPFGGTTRLRVSSQCLKRHWRTFDGEGSIGSVPQDAGNVPMAVRSRRSFDEYVYRPLIASGVTEGIAAAITEQLVSAVLGESAKAKKEKSETKEKSKKKDADSATSSRQPVHTSQVTVLGRAELDYIRAQGSIIASTVKSEGDVEKAAKAHLTKEVLENLKTMRLGAGLDGALFGRMVTSDYLARTDAAVHVAHAFTVHAEETESDYFSAIDDLELRDAALGSGHIGNVELTSGLYYGYVVVDVPLLVSNLQGCKATEWRNSDRALAAEVIRRLVHIVPTVSPGAKKGSTAPYAYADFVLAEWGTAQPRTLANAFESPVAARGNILQSAYAQLTEYVAETDAAYGRKNERRCVAIRPPESLALLHAEKGSLVQLAEFCAERLKA